MPSSPSVDALAPVKGVAPLFVPGSCAPLAFSISPSNCPALRSALSLIPHAWRLASTFLAWRA
jgi:hypothetical protein